MTTCSYDNLFIFIRVSTRGSLNGGTGKEDRPLTANITQVHKSAQKEETHTMKKSNNTSVTKENNILVAYFSHSGNTRIAANQIHESVGGNIFEIAAVDPYPSDYDEAVERAGKELRKQYRPKLKTKAENMESYNLVFLGYPNWWGTIPMPIATFLSEYDFSGKTIAPFCTNEGSRFGQSITDIKKLCPQSTILDGLAIRGEDVKNAQNKVSDWLHKLGMTE
jgi:flavodoxin